MWTYYNFEDIRAIQANSLSLTVNKVKLKKYLTVANNAYLGDTTLDPMWSIAVRQSNDDDLLKAFDSECLSCNDTDTAHTHAVLKLPNGRYEVLCRECYVKGLNALRIPETREQITNYNVLTILKAVA